MRSSTITRKTNETDIEIKNSIEGTGNTDIDTGIPFFDHMLNSFDRHVSFDITVKARVDVVVDDHHTTEALFKAFGVALKRAVRITGFGIPSTRGVL